MSLILVNKETEQEKEIPTGFSWTTLFFGIFVPLLRGYWPYFFGLAVIVLYWWAWDLYWLVRVPIFNQ